MVSRLKSSELDEQIAQVRSMLGGRAGKPIKAAAWAGGADKRCSAETHSKP